MGVMCYACLIFHQLHPKASSVSPYLACTCKTSMLSSCQLRYLQLHGDVAAAQQRLEDPDSQRGRNRALLLTVLPQSEVTAKQKGWCVQLQHIHVAHRHSRGQTSPLEENPAGWRMYWKHQKFLCTTAQLQVQSGFDSLYCQSSHTGSGRTGMCSLEESSRLWTRANKVVWERPTRKQCLPLGHLWLCPTKDGNTPWLSLCLTLPWMLWLKVSRDKEIVDYRACQGHFCTPACSLPHCVDVYLKQVYSLQRPVVGDSMSVML